MTPNALAGGLGFDRTPDGFATWSRIVRDEHTSQLLAAAHYPWVERETDLFPAGFSWSDLGDAGLHYLCFRTHFLLYASSPAAWTLHLSDLRLALLVALSISGHRASITVDRIQTRHGLLVDGANLFLWPADAPIGATLVLDGCAGTASIDRISVPAAFHRDRVILKPAAGDWFTTLPYREGFISFFLEEESEHGTDQRRSLLADESVIEHELCALAQAAAMFKTRAPLPWECVRQLVLYVNWTRGPLRESSTTISDVPGSMALNLRSDVLPDDERAAWVAHGLYHEAKHSQFFLSYRRAAGSELSLEAICRRLSEDRPRVPCAWRGRPTLRSMGAHLLSLQAFVPGLTLLFSLLPLRKQLSHWLMRRIEMDMRAVNGGLAALVLGSGSLTEEGLRLKGVLEKDYAEHLTPAYRTLDQVWGMHEANR